LEKLSVAGLWTIAWICIGAALFFLVVGFALLPEVLPSPRAVTAVLLLGVVLLPFAHAPWMRRRARLLGVLVGVFVALALTWGHLSASDSSSSAHFLSGHLAFVMLVGVAALPIRPVEMVGLGASIALIYGGFVWTYELRAALGQQVFVTLVMTTQVAIFCAILTAIVYRQRAEAFRARRAAEQSFEELREAQARLLVSQSAASQGRFAAALSHELNTPLGSLKSAVDTLGRAFDKLQENPALLVRYREVFTSARHTARESSQRLEEALARMRQLANLDRAETQTVDVSELCASTVALLRPELEGRAEVKLELKPLPSLTCRPQQMSAVLSNLLRNAAAAMDNYGVIHVVSHRRGTDIVVEVRDNGRGIAAERLSHLFDPAFHVQGRRVATTNWGLFVSRSIVVEHGGQIEIDSAEGKGTTARVRLPLKSVVRPQGSCTKTDGKRA
jgi:signal transduction histidine kinase